MDVKWQKLQKELKELLEKLKKILQNFKMRTKSMSINVQNLLNILKLNLHYL